MLNKTGADKSNNIRAYLIKVEMVNFKIPVFHGLEIAKNAKGTGAMVL